MADGVDRPSIKDGSDADFEFVCTPCGEDNIREGAVKYCPECEEFLCTRCTKKHGKRKATRSHKLVGKDDAKHSSVVATAAKCRYHPDRDIEMYCGTHDMVYCTKCIATEHRGCSSVKNLDELSQPQAEQKEIQRLQDEGANIYKLLVAISAEKQKNIDSLEDLRQDIQEKIKAYGKTLKEHIDKLTNQASDTLDCKFTETKSELESEVGLINDTIKDIEKSKHKLQKVNSMNGVQLFIFLKLVQKSIAEAQNVQGESEAKGTKAFDFTENTDLSKSIITATDLGQVVVKSENRRQTFQRQYKVKGKKDVNVKMQSDSNTCYISDVCQLQDGTILLTDYYNQKIKRLDVNYKVRDHCALDSYPTGICCTGQNEVAVKMYNDKVQFISVGTTFSLLRDMSIQGGCYYGIAYCDGELWVSTGSGISVYSKSGSFQKSIVKDESGQNIFKGTTQHIAVCEDTVVVTDYSDGAVCLGKDGTVKRQLRNEKLSSSISACVSYDKTVLLSGFHSNNIVIFSDDGKCQGELVTKEEGITYPGSHWYDDRKNCLIITCLKSCNTIHILEISHWFTSNQKYWE